MPYPFVWEREHIDRIDLQWCAIWRIIGKTLTIIVHLRPYGSSQAGQSATEMTVVIVVTQKSVRSRIYRTIVVRDSIGTDLGSTCDQGDDDR